MTLLACSHLWQPLGSKHCKIRVPPPIQRQFTKSPSALEFSIEHHEWLDLTGPTKKKMTELFTNIASQDHLEFAFGDSSYANQLAISTSKSKQVCAVSVFLFPTHLLVEHNFVFMGGSLGCAEGEKICLAFELAISKSLGIIVVSKTGGARMQEGTSSLMQMAKISVAVNALRQSHLPFVSILTDPTFGGVPASYAMQGDVRIVIKGARVGFAGPQVILTTIYKNDQDAYDLEQPSDFQRSSYLLACGQVDMEVADVQQAKSLAVEICELVCAKSSLSPPPPPPPPPSSYIIPKSDFDFTRSRQITRFQTQDAFTTLFTSFHELSGDGRISADVCLKGGLASFHGTPCIIMGTMKGHTVGELEAHNHGMPSPHGYRFATRLFEVSERSRASLLEDEKFNTSHY